MTMRGVAKRIVRRDGRWCVLSERGSRSFGCYPSRAQAARRLAQVEGYSKADPDPLGAYSERTAQELSRDVRAALERQARATEVTGSKVPTLPRLDLDPSAVLTRQVRAAGRAQASRTRVLEKDVTITYTFDLRDPAAEEWAARRGSRLVVEIDSSTRKALRRAFTVAQRSGGNPREVARLIRPSLGLHSRWATAVVRYQAGLLEQGRTEAVASRLAESYRARLLRARSLNVARTEILRAANEGKLEAWRQAQAQGLLGPRAGKMWVAAANAEPVCAAADGQVVPLGELFSTTLGSFEAPPAHPSCRCTAVAVSAA